jgi:predicted lipid-binding transport protein (Tim44 family)
MQELIEQVAGKVGLDAGVAKNALGAIMSFLVKEGPEDATSTLLDNVPGARELMAETANAGGGGLMGMMGGMMGGGIMGLGTKLMGMGLSMDQIKQVSVELFKHGKEKAGEDTMGEIVGGIPGLSNFI